MARNKFINPKDLGEYPWPVNHDTEEQFGKNRSITHSANTANVGLVRQQGETEPLTLRYTGTILTLAQVQAFWVWFNLCDSQTIFFEDCDGNRYEVIIASFLPIKKRVARNMSDPTNAPTNVWTYSIEMDVIRVVSGSLAGLV